jgi:hypothetical protein
MKSSTVLLAGLFASLSLAGEAEAGDHVYFHHTQPAYVYYAGPVYYPSGYGYYAPGVAYAPHAYVAPAAYPAAPVFAHPAHPVLSAPAAAWSCCPPKYHHVWPSPVYSIPAQVKVDYKYGLFGHVKGFTIRY